MYWDRIVPGLLSLLVSDLGVAPHSFASHCAAASNVNELRHILDALINDQPQVKAVIERGRLYGIETALPKSETLNWFTIRDPIRDATDSKATNLPCSLLAAAHLDGYLETCGCKSRQVGGLSRLATVVRHTREDTPNHWLALQVGFTLKGTPSSWIDSVGKQYDETFLSALRLVGFDALALSWAEVVRGIDELSDAFKHYDLPVVCCNLLNKDNELVFPPHRQVALGGRHVAIVGWLSSADPFCPIGAFQVGLAPFLIDERPERLKAAIDDASRDSDCVIVIGDIPHRFLRSHESLWRGVAVFVTASNVNPRADMFYASHGPHNIRRADTGAYKCGDAIVITAKSGPGGVLMCEPDRNSQANLHTQWLDETIVKAADVERVIRGLSVAKNEENPHLRQLPEGNQFLGASVCKACHPSLYEDWLKTSHAHAFDTLIDKQRDRHPQCVPCHVTGYYDASGYRDRDEPAILENVQCEICHGPGQRHVQSQEHRDIVRSPSAAICGECHNAEHSDQFVGRFDSAWQTIKHRGASSRPSR